MSFDEGYIHHLTQKYRIAVAIAVLKEKPDNIPTDEYIKELRNKLNNDIDDADLTICSDDFDFNENPNNDDINNDKVFDDTDICNIHRDSKGLHGFGIANEKEARERATHSQNKLNIQNDINNSIRNQHVSNENDENNNADSIAKEHNSTNILQNRNLANFQHDVASTFCETQTNSKCDFTDLNELRQDIKKSAVILNVNPNTIVNEDKMYLNEVTGMITEIPNDDTYYDSQATEIYSIYGFTENTHVSQSQYYEKIVVNDKLLKSKNNNISLKMKTSTANISEIVDNAKKPNSNPNIVLTNTEVNLTVNENHKLDENAVLYTENNVLNGISIEQLSNDMYNNAQDMEIEEIFPHCAQDFNEIQIYEGINIDEVRKNNSQYIEFDNNESLGANDSNSRVELNESRLLDVNEGNSRLEINEDSCLENDKIDDVSSNETQIVSFKVVEELNKIKNYISRRVERRMSNDGSVDSGYRSDSQSRSSGRNSLQQSGNWLNQSAHSLYNYITQCPLLATTQEIVSEIAQVLGQLIDKLQDEENYPSFLEELLENIDFLLRDVVDGSDGEDIILKKDENIQRLLLLNKSVHIQKYTIEKITKMLENLQQNLSNPDDTYELKHVTEIENISYIFYILEAILQRYIKVKDTSQEIANSQPELKKSSISDVWRKKWNPKYKEDSLLDNFSQKKCVLLSCNDVLNKLVVSCMDGYSLVAYSALQCFNLLQL